jgi:hypothetical protein
LSTGPLFSCTSVAHTHLFVRLWRSRYIAGGILSCWNQTANLTCPNGRGKLIGVLFDNNPIKTVLDYTATFGKTGTFSVFSYRNCSIGNITGSQLTNYKQWTCVSRCVESRPGPASKNSRRPRTCRNSGLNLILSYNQLTVLPTNAFGGLCGQVNYAATYVSFHEHPALP